MSDRPLTDKELESMCSLIEDTDLASLNCDLEGVNSEEEPTATSVQLTEVTEDYFQLSYADPLGFWREYANFTESEAKAAEFEDNRITLQCGVNNCEVWIMLFDVKKSKLTDPRSKDQPNQS